MPNKTLDEKTLTRYLGPSMVHPVEYWSKMWRLKDGGTDRHIVIKCPKEDHCILYYTDREGIEHRDALNNINQLPVEYRNEKVGDDVAKNINSSTPITYENIVALYGEPFIDPDIPFVYKWERGQYELTMIGKVFSYVQKGQDDRSTLSLFGQLPPDFRYALNNQDKSKESLRQTLIEMPDPEKVLKSTEASEKAKLFESNSNPKAEYNENANEIPTVATVSDDEFDLTGALKGMGIEVRKLPEDDDFPDDDDKFISSITAEAGGPPPVSDRKQMVVDVEHEEVLEVAALLDKKEEIITSFNEPKPYEGRKDGELNTDELAERRSWRSRKGVHTRKMNKLKSKK